MPKLTAVMLAVGFALSGAMRANSPPDDDRVTRARASVKQGYYARALSQLGPLLEPNQKNVPALLTASAACLGLGDPACSEKHLKVLAVVAPETPGYQLLRGRTSLLRADLAAAGSKGKKQVAYAREGADAFAKALAESPSSTTRGLLAMAQRAGKQTAEAKVSYMAWVAAAPRDPNAYGATAAFLAEIGDWSEAEKLAAGAPQDDPRLAHEIRVAVLRNGMTTVPWEAIRPFFDTVEAEEPDPGAKQALRAYRTVRATNGRPSMLAMLDYLDADPEDHFKVAAAYSETFNSVWQADAKSSDGFVAPEIQKRVDPIYPEVARMARIEGRVILACRIKKDGTTGSLHVISTSNPVFNDAALESARQLQYTPAIVDGKRVELAFLIQIDFRLRA